MSVRLAPSTHLKDKDGAVIGGPGDLVTLPAEQEAALILTGSAEPVDLPTKKKEK